MTKSKFILLAAGCMLCAQNDSRSIWDGVFTAAQSTRGEKLYAQNCASCHGTALTGGESAPSLTGGEFSSNWYGLTVGELFERIRNTMPADRPGRINRQQNADILSFILSMNRFPAGASELPTQTELLKQIRLEASPPEKRK